MFQALAIFFTIHPPIPMYSNHTSPVTTSSAPNSSAPRPFQRVVRSTLERVLGFLTDTPEVHDGHVSTLLQSLSGGGKLYLTRDAALAEIHSTGVPEILDVRIVRGCPNRIWEAVHAQFPEVRLGLSLPRFWLHIERVDQTEAVHFGVLDLAQMDILERGTERLAVEARVAYANAATESYLHEMAYRQIGDSVAVALRLIRGSARSEFSR